MGRKCSYPDCKSTDGLHSLPSNTVMARRWLHALGRVDTPSAPVYVCNLHFERDCFSNYAEVEMGFGKLLLLNPDAMPTPAKVVRQDGCTCRIMPPVRDVGSQTDSPQRRSVGMQLSMETVQKYSRSKATQVRVASRNRGVCTIAFPLDSPLLLLQPTIVKRPSKRPRLSLKDEEEGPSECSLSVVDRKPEEHDSEDCLSVMD